MLGLARLNESLRREAGVLAVIGMFCPPRTGVVERTLDRAGASTENSFLFCLAEFSIGSMGSACCQEKCQNDYYYY